MQFGNGFHLYHYEAGEKSEITNQIGDATNPKFDSIGRTVLWNEQGKVIAAFRCGIILTMRWDQPWINSDIFVPENLRTKPKGLLGNYNGDPSDDIISRNGTTLRSNRHADIYQHMLSCEF